LLLLTVNDDFQYLFWIRPGQDTAGQGTITLSSVIDDDDGHLDTLPHLPAAAADVFDSKRTAADLASMLLLWHC